MIIQADVCLLEGNIGLLLTAAFAEGNIKPNVVPTSVLLLT